MWWFICGLILILLLAVLYVYYAKKKLDSVDKYGDILYSSGYYDSHCHISDCHDLRDNNHNYDHSSCDSDKE